MITRFVVRPEAEADVAEGYRWYEGESPGLGDRFLAAVDAAMDGVRDAPQHYAVVHREPDVIVRRARLQRFPYAVFFIWDEAANATSVIACMHARRDPQRWLRRV